MSEPEAFEAYPATTLLSFWAISLLGYAASLWLLHLVRPLLALIFLAYLVGLEAVSLREGCVSCYYYGKRCFPGKGLVAGLLLSAREPARFCERKVTWKNLLPQVLAMAVPVLAGIYLILTNFSWIVAPLMAMPPVLWFAGNPIIYGRLGCPHCKQGRICCPANEFFGKKARDGSPGADAFTAID